MRVSTQRAPYWEDARMSVELPPRRTVGIFSVLGLGLGLVRVESPLLTAPDPAVRPQTLEYHFRGGCRGACVLAVRNPEAHDVFHQALNFGKLLIALCRGGLLRKF